MSITVGLASVIFTSALLATASTRHTRRPWRSPGHGHAMRGFDDLMDRVVAKVPFDPMIGNRALGLAIVAVVVISLVSPPLAMTPLLAVVVTSARRRRSHRSSSESRIAHGLPNVVDLLSMAVGAGLTPRLALASTATWLPEPWDSAAAEVERRATAGESFASAIDIVFESLGPEARPLTATLVAAHTDGAALLPALERVGDEARRRRRVAAQDRARRIPVAMLFPLVVCVLPAFALLTVVPLLIGSLSGLQLPG